MSLLLTKVTIADVDKLRQISTDTFIETFAPVNTPENMDAYLKGSLSISKLTEEILNKNSEFYFAISEGEIIGYLKVNYKDAQTEVMNEITLEVERIYIAEKHQGKKYGHQLLEKAKQLAININADFLWLAVWEKNEKAIKFYERHRFEKFGAHAFKLGSDMQTDLLMKLYLRS